MAEVAGLAIGVLGVAGLFTSCIENFDIIVRAQEFSEHFELQCTLLSLQRLHLAVWGETLGLVPQPNGVQRPYNQALARHDMRPVITSSLNQLQLLLSKADVITGRYALQEGKECALQSEPAVSSRGMAVFGESFEKFRRRIKKNQKQKSAWLVTKWSIHDHDKFESMVDNVTKIMDGLESIVTPLDLLEQQRMRVEQEIESLSDVESLCLLQEVGSALHASASLRAISETASVRLTSVESSSRSYYTARTGRSHPSVWTNALVSGASARHHPILDHASKTQDKPEDEIQDNLPKDILQFTQAKNQTSAPIEKPEPGDEPREKAPADLPQHQRWMAALAALVPQSEKQPIFSANDSDYGKVLRPIKQDDDESCTPKLARLSVQADIGLSLAGRMFLELRNIRRAAVPFISAVPVGDALDRILASIEGPPGTPYEGGIFYITVHIAEGKPPALRFHTRIYHPNVHPSGKLCADYSTWWRDSNLRNKVMEGHNHLPWFSEHITNHYTLGALLVAVCGLLASPDIDDPLVPEIAEKYLTDFQGYWAAAKLYTERYAHAGRPQDDDLLFPSTGDEEQSPVYEAPDFEEKRTVSNTIASLKEASSSIRTVANSWTSTIVSRYNLEGPTRMGSTNYDDSEEELEYELPSRPATRPVLHKKTSTAEVRSDHDVREPGYVDKLEAIQNYRDKLLAIKYL